MPAPLVTSSSVSNTDVVSPTTFAREPAGRVVPAVRVTVADERFDEELDLDVPGAHALAAFQHPFAYAAVRGLGFGGATRTSLDPQSDTQRSAA